MTCDSVATVRESLRSVATLLTHMTAESVENAQARLDAAFLAASQLNAAGQLTDGVWQRELAACRHMVCTANQHWERWLLQLSTPSDDRTGSFDSTA